MDLSPEIKDLLSKMLCFDIEERIDIQNLFAHPAFNDLSDN